LKKVCLILLLGFGLVVGMQLAAQACDTGDCAIPDPPIQIACDGDDCGLIPDPPIQIACESDPCAIPDPPVQIACEGGDCGLIPDLRQPIA
jgi:hypothetical protein